MGDSPSKDPLLQRDLSIASAMNPEEQKLHRAVRLNDPVATRELLVTAGGKIDPNCAEQKNNWSAVHYAAGNGFLEVLRILVEEARCDVNVLAKGHYSALHYASMQGFTEVVRYLIEVGKADTTVADKDHLTALHHAARFGHVEIVKYLCMNGAQGRKLLRAVDKDGLTAFDISVCSGQNEVARILRGFIMSPPPLLSFGGAVKKPLLVNKLVMGGPEEEDIVFEVQPDDSSISMVKRSLSSTTNGAEKSFNEWGDDPVEMEMDVS